MKWLVYSNGFDRVFCFYCKLFKHNQWQLVWLKMELVIGITFLQSSEIMKRIQNTITNIVKWVDLQMRLKQEVTIDKQMEALINKERVRWKLILTWIIGVVKTLSRNSVSFRGSNEKIYEKNNRLFCQLIKFFVEFDPIMKDHLRHVVDKEVQNHYLSHKFKMNW